MKNNHVGFLTLLVLFAFFEGTRGLAQSYEAGFQSRTSQLINRLADTAAIRSISGYFNQEFSGPGSSPDPEKHVWPVAIARFLKYGNQDTAGNRLVIKYKDREPFHFTYVGMARIMSQFPEATQMAVLKNQYLTRVWQRLDSYNPWTGEGTENHLSMNKTSGYLYAQHSVGNASFPNASARLTETKDWLRWFAKRLYQMGNSEWNSTTYQAYNAAGWLNLYDFSTDPEVKAIARAVLDYYAMEVALHCSQGLTGGAESRGNITGWGSGEDYLGWVWFGYQGRLMGQNFWSGREYSQSMHAAASTYRPPSWIVDLAQKRIPLPAYFRGSRPDYNQNIGSYVKQHFFADSTFTLGSAMIPTLGWAGGNSQYCNWKLISRINPGPNLNPQVVMGGSRFFNDQNGRGKTPWDQYLQHKHVLIQMHRIPANAAAITQADTQKYQGTNGWIAKWLADFDQRFPNDASRSNPVNFRRGSLSRNTSYISFPKNQPQGSDTVVYTFRSGVLFIQLQQTYLAVRSLAQAQPSRPANENTGRSFVADQAVSGSLAGLITEAKGAFEYTSFVAFQDSILAKTSLDKSTLSSLRFVYKNLDGDTLEARYTESGPAPFEPLYDWGFGPTTQQLYQTTPPFLQPAWASGPGYGRIPELRVNGSVIDLSATNWPVVEGPDLLLQNNILLVTRDSADQTWFYQVDFTGNNPIFTSGILAVDRWIQSGSSQALTLIPNPATHEVRASSGSLKAGKPVSIRILGIKGELIQEIKSVTYSEGGIRIDAHQLPRGVYQVVAEQDSTRFAGKLILNR